jgi:hypothetical protein
MTSERHPDPLSELSRAAAEFLGPIADVLVQHLAAQSTSFVKLREAVARQIDDPGSRERFRENTLPLVKTGSLPAEAAKAAQPAAAPTAAQATGLARNDPHLLRELTEELGQVLGHDAARIVREQAAGCANRVQLFLKLAKLVPTLDMRRGLEARALEDYRSRLK